jgi:uncharacterized membrane protein YphA (DoxX/SURF4 family)
MLDNRINSSWWLLRLTYGLVPIIAGLDKFLNLLTDWTGYLNPLALRVVPIEPHTFMHIVGVIEIIAGVIVLSRWTRFGAYLVSAWLVCIALNLLSMGRFFDIAVRDVVMAIGAFCLAKLSEAREPETARSTRPLAHKPASVQV